jgi:hypothetical protein
MTKIKVDEKGLNAREVLPTLTANSIVNLCKVPYPLTEPAEPNLVCQGDQIPMFSYDGEKWERCVIDTGEYICPTGAETKMFWQIVKPMQESKEENEVIYLDINDFAISEQDLERAFVFGYLANPDNNCLNNVEMMRRYEIFKTQYLLPMLQRKHIID